MGLEDPYGSLPTQHILPYESSKYQGAGWTLQGQSRRFFIRVQTQLARDEPQGELFSPLSDMQCAGSMVDTVAVADACALHFVFMGHTALGQGGKVPHTKP